MNCNKWSKNSDERWHNGLVTTRGGEWMHPYLDLDLIHVSLCQMSQSPKRHLDRFCRFFWLPMHFNGADNPPQIASSPTHLIHQSLDLSESASQTASRSVHPFMHSSLQCPYTLQWAAIFPPKLPLLLGD